MENDLDHKIAEFLAKVVVILVFDRLDNFVGFFDQVWKQ